LDSTIVEGYRAQVRALVRQYNSTDSALLELPFSGQSSQSVVPLKPLSRGSVHLSPDDDWDGRGSVEPVVDYRTFSHPVDLDFAVEMIKFVRGFFTGPAMTEALGVVELTPGLVNVPLDDPDNAAAKAWIRRVISPTTGHPVGTAGLGPIEYGGVVGPDLRVHKVGKLSVADNSIMNILPGTHTSSSAYAIGEKVSAVLTES
jgi:choline dehydrogenase-like flavoprotein